MRAYLPLMSFVLILTFLVSTAQAITPISIKETYTPELHCYITASNPPLDNFHRIFGFRQDCLKYFWKFSPIPAIITLFLLLITAITFRYHKKTRNTLLIALIAGYIILFFFWYRILTLA